ncbi:hypothetical protein BHECKSOX_463 [Bathymodiolus heckerae thiotrophic gill symbiont]|uniref:DUF6364 family protein n=1 Tax=Bathymodiolus heckerae thiotrophic gill symbiont TaxID=1052212 RepID=UPI0010B3B15C|nr:DUF6364 family protein [Bathymodiolus heckerae thiotrophic gill symbiont]SHN93554.1 hypothetical protein BHECKSOX_463 [Bathymodiolus heckerae thiotrophic gill symbiont]
MQTKLTLRLEETLIQQAKSHAKQHDKSLSQVVSDYFQLLTNGTKNTVLPPLTKSLVGVLESKDVDTDDYKKHLEEKYL